MGLFDRLKEQSGTASPAASGSIMDKLKALGDEQQVNPPADPEPPAETESPAEVESVSEDGEVCPTCGKTFKHLSRHKCKGVIETPEPIEGNGEGFTLMLDALFEKTDQPATLLADILAPLAASVAKENNVLHWAAVDFGKGGAFLAAKLQQWIVTNHPTGIILADSSTPETRAVKEVLRRAAKVIIRGIR